MIDKLDCKTKTKIIRKCTKDKRISPQYARALILQYIMQSQKAVTDNLKSKQLLHFDFARQNRRHLYTV